MSRVLAFDTGRTECRAALFEAGKRLSEVRLPGSSTASDHGGSDGVLEALRKTTELLESHPPGVEAVCAGLAGVFESWERAPEIAAGIRQFVEAEEVLVTSDVVTSYCGALGGLRPGVVIAAGTGAVAFAVGEDGAYARADGWGYLLGDEGSGYAIGRAGVVSALRSYDGRGGSEELKRLAEERLGSLERLAGKVHGTENPVRLIAGFAPDVAAAARGGDMEAQRIWKEAARSLAETAAAAAGGALKREEYSVSWTGGLFGAEDLLRGQFELHISELLPESSPAPPVGDALRGAGLLGAAPRTAVLEELVFREDRRQKVIRRDRGAGLS